MGLQMSVWTITGCLMPGEDRGFRRPSNLSIMIALGHLGTTALERLLLLPADRQQVLERLI